jgi:hypothetical protein
MSVRNLILVALLAGLAFGGTFTCTTGGTSHVHTSTEK